MLPVCLQALIAVRRATKSSALSSPFRQGTAKPLRWRNSTCSCRRCPARDKRSSRPSKRPSNRGSCRRRCTACRRRRCTASTLAAASPDTTHRPSPGSCNKWRRARAGRSNPIAPRTLQIGTRLPICRSGARRTAGLCNKAGCRSPCTRHNLVGAAPAAVTATIAHSGMKSALPAGPQCPCRCPRRQRWASCHLRRPRYRSCPRSS